MLLRKNHYGTNTEKILDAGCWKKNPYQTKGSSTGIQRPETSITSHQSIECSIHQLVGLKRSLAIDNFIL